MSLKLKKFRVNAGLTQAKLAAAVDVSQPNYQRWESGAAPIPDSKLKKLAKALRATPQEILGKHPPIEAAFYDESAGDELSYYGEVAIHFHGAGDALLLSISEAEYQRLHRDLQGEAAFVNVESLANQTVILRVKGISDLYFSSEAYDDYGPEHGFYSHHIEKQIPDQRDWEIIENLAMGEVDTDEFEPTDVERVQSMVMITDEQYEKLVTDGLIKQEDLEDEKAKNQAETDIIFTAASNVRYQLTNGKIRDVSCYEDEEIYNAFYSLIEFGDNDDDSVSMIRLATDGYHRTLFVNKDNLDYISLPTHKYKNGEIEAAAEALDSMPE